MPPGCATTLHWASQPLPGTPFSGPASHSSSHSTRLLPQPSLRQLALQPSHDEVLPSSHCSPGSGLPSPHAALSPGHGGSNGFRTGTVGGFTCPVMTGGRAGSRNSMMFVPPPAVNSLPRIVACPLARSAFSPPVPPLVRISLD
jgi:hypothetical protein